MSWALLECIMSLVVRLVTVGRVRLKACLLGYSLALLAIYKNKVVLARKLTVVGDCCYRSQHCVDTMDAEPVSYCTRTEGGAGTVSAEIKPLSIASLDYAAVAGEQPNRDHCGRISWQD